MPSLKQPDDEQQGPIEIAISGDLAEHENDIYERLLSVPPGANSRCGFNSPGAGAPIRRRACLTGLSCGHERDRRRAGRVLIGRDLALRRLPPPHRHGSQRPPVSSAQVGKRRARCHRRSRRMGPALRSPGARHGRRSRPAVRHGPRQARPLDEARPLRQRSRPRRCGLAEIVDLVPRSFRRCRSGRKGSGNGRLNPASVPRTNNTARG